MDGPDPRVAISLESVGHIYQTLGRGGDVEAVRDISFSIESGEFVSLVGPSGCGKSTLLNLIAGLDPATSGQIFVEGTLVETPRRTVAMMFQSPHLFPWRNSLENTLLPLDINRENRLDHVERAYELLKMVGLSGFETAYPRELSGGMQQRVALSRTLMSDPELMLMDEPFGSLDEQTRERLNLELLRIWEHDRKTVLFVTHHIGEAAFLSDRVLVMAPRPGRVIRDARVPLERPRTVDMLRSPEYVDFVFEIRELLVETEEQEEMESAGQ